MLNLDPSTLITRIITLIVAFTVHEFAHAWTATRFGDNTPRQYGRLSLNPLVHLDPLGSLALLLAGFGWAKPVPVNPYILNRRSSSALMWVSLAGPLSNLMLALLAAIPLRFGLIPYSTWSLSRGWLPSPGEFLIGFIWINLVLCLFNLIPIAPLDGDKILEYFAPPSIARVLETIRPMGPLLLMLVVFVLPTLGIDILGFILYPALSNLLSLLLGGSL
ncbi:MAG: site-2 protease family protein [Thermanaerothrix sp.]|uniref:site-2 protease family protein n=1 Tax=Thermanaerothrix sp. TaxID=2972675 RepID=UPI003C79D658